MEKIKELIKAEIADCHLSGEQIRYKVIRKLRGSTAKKKGCRNAYKGTSSTFLEV